MLCCFSCLLCVPRLVCTLVPSDVPGRGSGPQLSQTRGMYLEVQSFEVIIAVFLEPSWAIEARITRVRSSLVSAGFTALHSATSQMCEFVRHDVVSETDFLVKRGVFHYSVLTVLALCPQLPPLLSPLQDSPSPPAAGLRQAGRCWPPGVRPGRGSSSEP